MFVSRKVTDFMDSEVGVEARRQLLSMTENPTYATPTTFTSDNDTYPDNRIPFVDKHMQYLSLHPQVNTETYLANLRLKTRAR